MAKKPCLKLTKLEIDMLLSAVGFAQAGEWPWEPYKKRDGKALESAARKLGAYFATIDSSVLSKEK